MSLNRLTLEKRVKIKAFYLYVVEYMRWEVFEYQETLGKDSRKKGFRYFSIDNLTRNLKKNYLFIIINVKDILEYISYNVKHLYNEILSWTYSAI